MELKNIRLINNLSQKEFSRKVGVENSTVSMWEKGKSYPRPITAAKVAELLGITIDELYRSIDESKTDKSKIQSMTKRLKPIL